MAFLVIFFVFAFGACVGSFLNVCIYRIPEEKSIVFPASACASCNVPIKWYDNIPIFSAFILRWRCRNCASSFSKRYTIVELLTGLCFLLVCCIYGTQENALILVPVYWFLTALLIAVSFIDIDHYIIPDIFSVGGALAGMILAAVFPSLMEQTSRWTAFCWSAFGFFAGGGILFLIAIIGTVLLKEEAMGMGDVKLLAMIGAFLGWKMALFSLVISSFLGSIVGIAILLLRKKGLRYKIPYGPYISAAAFIGLLYGEAIINWYQKLFSFQSVMYTLQ